MTIRAVRSAPTTRATRSRVSRRAFLGLGAALTAPGGLAVHASVTARPTAPASRQQPVGTPLRGVPAALLCDALTRLGFDRADFTLSRGIGPRTGLTGTMIGPAVTTKYVRGGGGTIDDIRRFVFDPVDGAAAGSVWVIESGTDQIVSMLGELIAVRCGRVGLAGILTDGGCRDVGAIGRLGVPLYSTGSVLYGPGSVSRPVAANVPVTCGGVAIRPGDLVAADVDGALVVPREAVDEVARMIEELRAKEDRTRVALDGGASLRDAYLF